MESVARMGPRISRAKAIALTSIALAIGLVSPAFAGIGQWTTNGPYGGLVTVLAIDPHTPANLYAAGISGVFKTSDGGANWARASNGITDPSVDALAIDPATPTTLYAGSVFGGKMIKSTDGAATWNTLATAPTLVAAIGIDPQVPATLYVSQQGSGLLKSIDSGATWNKIGVATLPTFPNFKSLIVDPHTSATVYAGENSQGIYKSLDGGTTWSPANTGFNGPIIQIWALAIDPTSPSTLYASASTSSGQGLYKTTDGGDHWTNVLPVSSAVVIQSIVVDPQTTSTLYVGSSDGKVSKSINGGTNFSPVTTGLPGYGMVALAINPQSTSTIYGGSTNGIFKTTNGGTAWTAASNGLALTAVNSVAVDPITPTTIYAGTRSSGIFKSVDGGGSWASIYTGIGTTGNLSCVVPEISSIAVDPSTPSTLYAGTLCTQSKQVLKSVNGGTSWTPAATGLPLFGSITAVAIDPQATSTIYAGTSGLYQSVDGGAHWTAAIGVPTTDHVSGLSLAVPPPIVGGRTTVVVATSDDGVYVLQSGTTFQPYGFPGGGDPSATNRYVDVLCVQQAKTILVNYLVRSASFLPLEDFESCITENLVLGFAINNFFVIQLPPMAAVGPSTERTSSLSKSSKPPVVAKADPLPETIAWGAPDGDATKVTACSPVAALVGNPFDDHGFYAASGCGVLKGTNSGQQLATMSTGLPTNQPVNSLGITPAGDTLYAGTSNGGVYQFTFPPQPPTQLAITSVNGEASPVAGFPFSVVVQAQAADMSPQAVAAATTVQLSVSTGTATLGGTQSCQILAGSSNCTVTGVTYSKAEVGVVLTATSTAGDSLTAGNSAPFDVVAVGPPPSFVSAVSRKVHGTAGTFDLSLSLVATNPTTEPRIGPAQTIVLTFDKPITGAVVNVTEGTATAAAPTFSGNDVVVGLTGVTNQQYVTVALTNVASSDGGSGGSGSVRLGFLLGDVNQNRVVSVADLGLVNAQLAQVVTAANFLKDVNASGTLSVADKGITNANLTRNLPAP